MTGLGVKNLTLIDGDLVEASNLHRQFLYTIKDIGKKYIVLKKAIYNRYYGLNIKCIEDFINEDNVV